ncbi:ArsR/SmtB family transcription factor [Vibrio rumoiensis]|uniref:Transcriptional regulator n=1 Tax=Vibrio rumoiensis 1S-45 TaxID=1188252 RepID=A0A1E5DYJ9_9VIBR|nr:winged helix-turn-helix domain-containing protein [Vibrio rumoiensis]OEF22656.1 transcriptional regulator [Vibrio rumoiensis 1S-45]
MTQSCSSSCDALQANSTDLQQEQEFALLAKALSHPARVRILKILINLDKLGGCLNSDLVAELGLAQSTVSEHLRILKVAGFITAEPIPPKMCYRINPEKTTEFKALVKSLID